MNIKEGYILARCWELRNGEGFVEYFGDNFYAIREDEIMEWMKQKGYISKRKLELFRLEKHTTLCDCFCGYEVEYSLFPNGECDEQANFKAELIIAEYLVEKGITNLLYEFAFNGEGWAWFDTEELKKEYQEDLQSYIDSWNDEDYDGYSVVLKLSIDDINKRLKKEN